LIESVAIDGPRFDYNPTTLAPNGLLIEEQRVNLFLRSEEFDNVSWSKTNGSVSPNVVIAPDGTLTGDIFVPSAGLASHRFAANVTMSGSTTYTQSIYAKAAGYNRIALYWVGLGYYTVFDLSTGQVISTLGGISSSITDAGNGWYRISNSYTQAASPGAGVRIYTVPSSNTTIADFDADGTSGNYIWGAQLEAGAFPTSYIPTVASQVTRTADSAVMTGTNFSSWFNQTEGTIYAEGVLNNLAVSGGQVRRLVDINDNTTSNRIFFGRAAGGLLARVFYTVSGTNLNGTNGQTTGPVFPSGRLAVAFKAGDYAFSGNGSAVVTNTGASVPVVNRLNIGGDATVTANGAANGTISRIAFYPSRLADSELQAITS
jgi:hypothetical protein